MEWSEVKLFSVEWSGVECSVVVWCAVAQWNGLKWNGVI